MFINKDVSNRNLNKEQAQTELFMLRLPMISQSEYGVLD